MIRRIAASLAALIAASILVSAPASADEAPQVYRHATSLARHIDWD